MNGSEDSAPVPGFDATLAEGRVALARVSAPIAPRRAGWLRLGRLRPAPAVEFGRRLTRLLRFRDRRAELATINRKAARRADRALRRARGRIRGLERRLFLLRNARLFGWLLVGLGIAILAGAVWIWRVEILDWVQSLWAGMPQPAAPGTAPIVPITGKP